MKDLKIANGSNRMITFSTLDFDGDICVELHSDSAENMFDYINKQQAGEIIAHLQKVFNISEKG